MKIMMGVDNKDSAAMIADMLKAFRFNMPQLDVVHVTETWSDSPVPALKRQEQDLIARYIEMVDDEAKSLLSTVQDNLKAQPFPKVIAHHLKGFVTNSLLKHAEDTHADLVAIASSNKGPIEGLLIGSVSRKTAIAAKISVLFVKKIKNQTKPLTVVFATDHSPYSMRCLEELKKWEPQGFGRIIVTTVYPEPFASALGSFDDNFKVDVSARLHAELENANLEVCKQLKTLGADCLSRVESGSVNDKLAQVMKEEQADLLIVGAQGRSFFERMTLGSVSFDQVMKRSYSVLVVRV
jgi:nucleotide-binding universal stress UspA family protein